MIVRPEDSGLLLITQAEHAALAAAVVDAWQADGWPNRPTRAVTVLATAHHDDGWAEEDAAPRWDPAAARPHDFLSLPHRPRQHVWRRGLRAMSGRSTYATALIAQHVVSVTRSSRSDPEWDAFISEMERERDRWFASAPAPVEPGTVADPAPHDRLEFLRDYAMLSMGDLVSLIFCSGWQTPYEQDGFTLHMVSTTRLEVLPDPFGGREVRVDLAARWLATATFDSEIAWHEAWLKAPVTRLEGSIAGAGSENPS